MNQSQADIPREVLEGKADDIRFPKTVAETAKDLSRADADTLKRRLQREAKRGGPEAITRIEKTETAYGFFALPKMPHQFVHQAGELRPVETASAGLAITRAVFDLKAAEASTNRNETMTAYTRTLNGVEVSPTKRDFILFDEAFACEFRPVFRYAVGGTNHVGLADIGRHGAPSPVFGLFGNCRVAFDPAQPEHAILLPDFGTVKFSTSPLAWFSSASEGFFSRWVYLFTLVTIGAGLITISLIAISLVLKPSVRLQIEESATPTG
jgi:hypothetical protein